MRAMVFGISTCALVGVLQAQPLDLRGRVVQANGVPIPEAVVELKVRGAATKTAADGSFTLDVNASLGPAGGRPFEYRLHPDFLAVDVRAPLELRLEVIDCAGRTQGGHARHLETGRHRIAWAKAMPALGRGTVFAPAYRDAAAKRAAAVDSLRVRKAGYQEFVKEIASYTAGNLGDLILSATMDDGSVCAMVTADGFVTVAGESYPYPTRNGSDPEMRRHASAVKAFEVLSRNG